ncbi:MAG: helix-turn-helix transcriptional regulator [Sediminibacterium sp.]
MVDYKKTYKNNPEEILKIGLRIRNRRIKLKWTMMELAYESGIDYRQIGRIERGETNFTIKTLIRISIALNFGLKDLIK